MSFVPGGYHGRYLKIDVASGRAECVPIPETVLRQFIGGVGLGTWLLLEETNGSPDPLAPDAPLIFAFSPLVGSPLTTSAKFAVVAKSPLTQRINDSLASSHFALAGKKTGYDALVLTGRAESLSCLLIDNGAIEVQPVSELQYSTIPETERVLRERYRNAYRFAAIGPAGERLVRYATISHDGRHAGRGGLGAVMGVKNLKAIGVRGDRLTELADPAGVVRISRGLSQKSFGEATEKYRELGTAANLLVFNRLGTLPTRNFQEGEFAAATELAPETMSAAREKSRKSCAACTIGCEHLYPLADGGTPVRMEYENLFALGPLCGVGDSETVLRASRLCDEFGLDTISTGGTIAFAMEAAERGLIDLPEYRFGRGDTLLSAIERIAERSREGDLLAEGSRIAAEKIGQGSAAFAPQVKGLELPGYEPRALQSMALGFAVGTRGADHNRSGAYQADFSEEVDRMNLTASDVRHAIETENEAAIMDSLILCKFLRGALADRMGEMAEMLRCVTGWDVTREELERTAGEIVTAKKRFNISQGWTPEEDTLPERFLSTALESGQSAGARLTRERLEELVRAYNLARGWSAEGYVE